MYCLNLHPGESLSEVIDVLRGDVAAVKRAIAPEHPYEIGLRLGNRAAAPLPVAARHRSTRLCIVHTLRVLHAVACQRGLPARDTVRGRTAQSARYSYRAAITHGALPGRRDRDIAPYRHYTRNIRTPHSHGRGVRLATLPARALHARRGSRPRAVPLGGVRGAIPVDVRRAHPPRASAAPLPRASRPRSVAPPSTPPRPCPRTPGRRPHHASKIRGNAKTRIAPDFFFFCAQNAAAAN